MGTGLTITVDSVDISAYVDCRSIQIEEVGTERVATCSFEVRDHSGTVSIEAKDSVDIRPTGGGASTVLFGGEVSDVDIERQGVASVFRVRCHCNNILIDERVVEYESYAAGEADSDTIADLFSTYRSDIDASTYVDTIDAAMDAIRFEQMTLREVMDAICQRTGGRYYVDYAKKLHYFEAESGNTASFSLSTTPDLATSFPFKNWRTKEDGTQLVTHLYIIGEDISGWWPSGVDGPDWSIDERHGVTYARGATTQAELEAHGAAVLAAYNTARVTYECTTEHDGLRAGQYLDVVHEGLSIDDSFYIRSMRVRILSNDGDLREYELELNDESPDPVRQQRQSYQDTVVIGTIEMPLGHRGWTHDIVFSATDYRTIAWAAGTITLADGRTSYSIDAGSVGSIAAVTYIYLDVDTSTTVLQTTTDNTASIGENKILICVCQNVADTDKFAVFQVFGGKGIGGTFLTADNLAANCITANEIAANTITAAEIASETITAAEIAALTITGAKIAANTLTADKLVIGESPFSLSDGLLLLTSPFQLERGSTNYIVGTRGDKATITGGIHFEPGRWQGTQGLVMEPSTTNLVTNPSMELGTTTFWNKNNGTETMVASSDQSKFGGYSLFVSTTSNTNTEGIYSDTIAVSEYVGYTYSVWIRTASSVFRLVIVWYDAGSSAIGSATQNITGAAGRWMKHTLTAVAPAGAVTARVAITEISGSATVYTYYADGFQFEALDFATSTCIGDMAHCAWSGTAHASTSTRTGQALTITYNGNIYNWVGSIAMWVNIPDDWNTAAGFLWCGGNANAEFDAYIDSNGAVLFRINGSTRCQSSNGAISTAAWHHIVFTWNASSDVSYLYIDGALADTDTCGGGAPTLGTSLGIGYSAILASAVYNLNGIIGEFASTQDVLTENEVEELYQLQRPLIDLGATQAPGILLINTKGDRIEITAQELAVYSDNSKCVEVDNDGIAILTSSAYADVRSYQMRTSSGAMVGKLQAYTSGGYNYCQLIVPSTASTHGIINIEAQAPTSYQAQVSVTAYRSAGVYATMTCDINAGSGYSQVMMVVDGTIQAYADSTGFRVNTKIYGSNDLVFETGGSGTYAFRPDYARGSGYLGNGTYYWNEIHYKTLSDDGCLADFGPQIEMPDKSTTTPLGALRAIQTHPSKISVQGAPMLDYKSFPVACYIPGLQQIADKDIYDVKGNLVWKKGEPSGDEGIDIGALTSLMLAAIKELAGTDETTLAAIKELAGTDETTLAAIAALEARVAKMEGR